MPFPQKLGSVSTLSGKNAFENSFGDSEMFMMTVMHHSERRVREWHFAFQLLIGQLTENDSLSARSSDSAKAQASLLLQKPVGAKHSNS